MKTKIRLFLTATFCAVLLAMGSSASPAATFSDANWSSMGGVPGTDGQVYAAAVDGAGNLYVGGNFSVAGDVFANSIAKWDGTNWSALGSGMGGGLPSTYVFALAVSGPDLYAAGNFRNAGGKAANNVAKWDGKHWRALGGGG